MRINFFGLALLFLSTFISSVNSQTTYRCGVSAEEGQKIMAQMQQNRHDMRDFVFERGAVTYVPVRFFLVAKSDGTDRASEKKGLAALCLINENYEDQDIQFYLKEFKYINSNTIFSNPTSNSGGNAIANQMIYNAINIFIVNEMAEDGVLAYYQPDAGPNGNDWIVSLESAIETPLVLTHEVGHFFSLNHTFYGWESSGGWDENIHGNPVGSTSPDGIPNERVNMSNCLTAGDGICDTPADYMFPNQSCAYTQDAKDPNGQSLLPDTTNFMNYVYGCPDYHFSDDQKEEINNSLFHSTRNYIRPNYTPNLTNVTGSPTIIGPIGATPVYNNVTLSWTSLPGADKYLVSILASGVETRYISNTNSLTLTNLQPNTGHLWKVLGYNEFSTCGGYSGPKIFTTGDQQVSAANDLPENATWSVGPNPVRSGSPLFVNVETTNGLEADVRLLTTTGQVLKTLPQYKFNSGQTSLEISSEGLPAGIYLVSLQTVNGFHTQRVSVVR